MKKAAIIISVFLLLILVGESVYLFQQNAVIQKFSIQQASLQQQASDLTKEKASLSDDKSRLQVEVGKVTQENKSLSDEVARFEGEGKIATEKAAALTKKLDEKSNYASKLLSENSALKQKYTCKNQITNVDFSSNDTVNKALVSYLNQHKTATEPISAHYWKLIWTDSKYSTHTIEVNSPKNDITYVYTFTVYFKGEYDGYHENGIFANDKQCWLYLDR